MVTQTADDFFPIFVLGSAVASSRKTSEVCKARSTRDISVRQLEELKAFKELEVILQQTLSFDLRNLYRTHNASVNVSLLRT